MRKRTQVEMKPIKKQLVRMLVNGDFGPVGDIRKGLKKGYSVIEDIRAYAALQYGGLPLGTQTICDCIDKARAKIAKLNNSKAKVDVRTVRVSPTEVVMVTTVTGSPTAVAAYKKLIS